MKFVVSSDPQSPYHTIPSWALDWKTETGRQIYISPMMIYNSEPQAVVAAMKSGTMDQLPVDSIELETISFWEPGLFNLEVCRRNMGYAALLCMKIGGILSLQTHLLAELP